MDLKAKSLEQRDRQVRAAVRKWLCLPHDNHTAFFHARVGDGGLEVPRLCYLIPPMKAQRMAKTEESDEKVLLSSQLHASVDGRGLRQQGQAPHVNRSVTDGSALLLGWDYIQSVKLRGNLLPSTERMSRGRWQVPVLCDAGCNAQGTLAHTSQSCTRTHRLRCDRHDSVL